MHLFNHQLNEEDYLEKEIKQNDFFKDNGMITQEQCNKEREEIKEKIQQLPRYRNKK